MKRFWRLAVTAVFCAMNASGFCAEPLAERPIIHRVKLIYVQSEVIRAIGYHYKTKTLQIAFVSGEMYRYANVSRDLYHEFIDAPSKGHFFHEHIRGHFDYWKIEPGQL